MHTGKINGTWNTERGREKEKEGERREEREGEKKERERERVGESRNRMAKINSMCSIVHTQTFLLVYNI